MCVLSRVRADFARFFYYFLCVASLCRLVLVRFPLAPVRASDIVNLTQPCPPYLHRLHLEHDTTSFKLPLNIDQGSGLYASTFGVDTYFRRMYVSSPDDLGNAQSIAIDECEDGQAIVKGSIVVDLGTCAERGSSATTFFGTRDRQEPDDCVSTCPPEGILENGSILQATPSKDGDGGVTYIEINTDGEDTGAKVDAIVDADGHTTFTVTETDGTKIDHIKYNDQAAGSSIARKTTSSTTGTQTTATATTATTITTTQAGKDTGLPGKTGAGDSGTDGGSDATGSSASADAVAAAAEVARVAVIDGNCDPELGGTPADNCPALLAERDRLQAAVAAAAEVARVAEAARVAAAKAAKGGNSTTIVIVIVVVVVLIVCIVAAVFVMRPSGGGSAAQGGVVSFENPMYDTANKQNPAANYAMPQGDGAAASSGYMDVPVGGGGGGGGGGGYMDVSPNAGGAAASSGYMDVGAGGYGDSDEEDV